MTQEHPQFVAHLIDDWSLLESMKGDWDALAGAAIEASPSSESWMLLPALRHLNDGGEANVKVLLIHANDADAPDGRGMLCGLFPLVIFPSYSRIPIRTIRIWDHVYSLFPAPLLRAGSAHDCIRCYFSWATAERLFPSLLEFPNLRADSEFFRVLTDVLWEDGVPTSFVGAFSRAMFRPRQDAQRYLDQVSTPKHRHEMRRQERRLSELGDVRYDQFSADSDLSAWLEEFIALEKSGWKGERKTAFGSRQSHRDYLFETTKAAAARGQLMMLALRLDGKPIAMKLNFLVNGGGYAFKIAFDEKYSRYSPGMLLELENIRRLHDNHCIGWMDSLAAANHQLKNRVWLDRTAIVTFLVAPGGALSALLLAVLPLMRWLKRRIHIRR